MAPPYKFKFNDPPPSDDAIQASQGFTALLEKRKKALKRKRLLRKLLICLTIVAILVAGIFFFPLNEQEREEMNSFSLPRLEPIKPQLSEKLLLPTHIVKKVPRPTSPTKQDVDTTERAPESKTQLAEDTIQAEPGKFTEARPEGGYEALYTYIAEELVYPVSARTDSIEGTVVIEFKINKEGMAQDAKIIQHVREDIDQEALRLINSMSRWYPAMINDIPITTRQIIPITFKIDLQGEED